jgi:hypothetical protein
VHKDLLDKEELKDLKDQEEHKVNKEHKEFQDCWRNNRR